MKTRKEWKHSKGLEISFFNISFQIGIGKISNVGIFKEVINGYKGITIDFFNITIFIGTTEKKNSFMFSFLCLLYSTILSYKVKNIWKKIPKQYRGRYKKAKKAIICGLCVEYIEDDKYCQIDLDSYKKQRIS